MHIYISLSLSIYLSLYIYIYIHIYNIYIYIYTYIYIYIYVYVWWPPSPSFQEGGAGGMVALEGQPAHQRPLSLCADSLQYNLIHMM